MIQTDDLSRGIRQYAHGREVKLDMPQSDVLIYRLENNARVIVRPSGTEPKLKCYYEVVETMSGEEFGAAMQRAELSLSVLAESHQASITELLG